MKINNAATNQDGSARHRPFCQICNLYHIPWDKGGWMCPNCGRRPEVEQVMKAEEKILLQANVGESVIAHKEKPKKDHSMDFPYGAQIIKDDTFYP